MGRIPEYAGDIFAVPEGSVIIHACNCMGQWGAGFAAHMKAKFPEAYKIYREKCLNLGNIQTKRNLVGTTLLIPPQKYDTTKSGGYWVACLFTSLQFGTKKDKPDVILENTKQALMSFKEELQKVENADPSVGLTNKLFAVRINAKAFNVPWASTRVLLVQSGLDIGVVNNLEIMGETEREQVTASMVELGFDTTIPPSFTAATTP